MIFNLPNIIFVMLRPLPRMKPNEVLFQVPRHLNKLDIKNYLESVYKLKDVKKINTIIPSRKRILHPNQKKFHRHPNSPAFLWKTVYKRAFVELAENFQFPDRPEPEQKKIEKDEAEKERRISFITKSRAVFDKWDEVVAERFGPSLSSESSPQLLLEPMCDPLATPLKNLVLSEGVKVKGGAKRRIGSEARIKLTGEERRSEKCRWLREVKIRQRERRLLKESQS